MPITHGGNGPNGGRPSRLPAGHARRQCADQRIELASRDLGLAKLFGSAFVDTANREYVLGEIDSDRNNGHDFPFRMS